jgi:hypothetical protein
MPSIDPIEITSVDEILEISETYEERLQLLHQFTEQKVGHTLFLIDEAISAWNAAGKKPESLRRRIIVLQEFKDSFTDWEKKSVLSRKKKQRQKKVLEDFFRLCDDFEDRLGALGG